MTSEWRAEATDDYKSPARPLWAVHFFRRLPVVHMVSFPHHLLLGFRRQPFGLAAAFAFMVLPGPTVED